MRTLGKEWKNGITIFNCFEEYLLEGDLGRGLREQVENLTEASPSSPCPLKKCVLKKNSCSEMKEYDRINKKFLQGYSVKLFSKLIFRILL